MSRRKGGGGDEGGNWMDTYGDMVTLLIRFTLFHVESGCEKMGGIRSQYQS